MSEKAFYISRLIQKQLREELSPAEQMELNDWLNHSANNKQLFEQLNNEKWVSDELEKFGQYNGNSEAVYNLVNDKGGVKIRTLIKRIAVAASIIMILGISSYFLFFNEPVKQEPVVTNVTPIDIKAPETNRAMITLADGRTVYLDSAGNGTLVSQAGVNVIKMTDGQIIYDGVSQGEIIYNTLNNPRGSKVIDMTLADGSRVWLNAESSVTYPVAFVGNERKVVISGEAYFEIAHDANKPFVVSKGDVQVQVLGTSFNVNAYDDEQEMKVTLLEGSVRTSIKKNEWVILKPGEQAKIGNEIQVKKEVNLEAVIAWKNGLFAFDQSDLKSVMRQIARWYDMEVEYEGNIPDRKFGGAISRMNNVSKVLRVLEESQVKFSVEGRKIRVLN